MSTSNGSVQSAHDITLYRASAHALSFHPIPFDGNFQVDRDGFLSSPHRAGGPILCSLLARPAELSPEFESETRFRSRHSKMLRAISNILRDRGIEYLSLSLGGRRSIVDPEEEALPTCLIITKQNPRGATGLAKYIHQILRRLFQLKVNVDIIESFTLKPLRCIPVHSSEAIYRLWDSIASDIIRTLHCNDWAGIGCWRYGMSETPQGNPITVIVRVRKESNRNWSAAGTEIQNLLGSRGIRNTNVLFERNSVIWCFNPPLLEVDAITQAVYPGVSLGIHSSMAGSSTLGGLVELHWRGKPSRIFALTAFHCVYPPHGRRQGPLATGRAQEVFKRWETSPLRPQERTQVQGLLEIDHPSLEDLKNTLEDLDLYIQRTETRRFRDIAQAIRSQEADPNMCFVDPRDRNWYNTQRQASETLRRQRDKVRSFIERETYTLGPVFAGSELWRSQNHTYRPFILDWALIEIPEERRGTNTPYRYRHTRPLLSFDSTTHPEHDNEYSKVGRSTGYTSGKYSGLREVHLHKVDDQFIETWEHTVSSGFSDQPFAQPGDSGSFVFDPASREVVGLFLGGRPNGTGIFTPIEAVFSDIKDITGASHVQVA
ncbi:hypothetical protein PDE_03976 [Penicillium oxalicum 114-2]|uniref:Uncharacterized protein n=1 Tax=Penicillium oxalicum (strain 114-2 / CGMCC 5302) TaxID=933388 RepID=S7ZEE2_PENO1|nr:hypothetical protein PDE_03976 [Penicillium oxalicum 114-2]